MAKRRKKNRNCRGPEEQGETKPTAKPPQEQPDDAAPRIILPPSDILIWPPSPHDRRMQELSVPVPREGTLEAAQLQKLMEMDIAFRLQMKEIEKKQPHLLCALARGGSNLQLSELLRWYAVEYTGRFCKHGPESMPSSFNIVEAFIALNQEYAYFNLRAEVEHLLPLDGYFQWYAADQDTPMEPRMVVDALPEDTIHSYEMVSDTGGFRISGNPDFVVAGVCFVRHEHELSCLLLAGERPPLQSDEEISELMKLGKVVHGRKGIKPAPDLTVEDRYLAGYTGFARVILLTRFDLRSGTHDVRYVQLDTGQGFTVLTDDSLIYGCVSSETANSLRKTCLDNIKRYDPLFSSLASMIYLPVFFASSGDRIKELVVSTDMVTMREDDLIRKTIKELGESACTNQRTIRCLPVASGVDGPQQQDVDPPDLKFECTGFWKPIGLQEVGEDKNGSPIIGRTWVSRNEQWSAQSPQSFLLQKDSKPPDGPDPGVVYVQRSASHAPGVYKVGLTRRSAKERAAELSSATGVPLPFGVLAHWPVGDCSTVEKEVHERLKAHRINPRREFFAVDLPVITKTVQSVIDELA